MNVAIRITVLGTVGTGLAGTVVAKPVMSLSAALIVQYVHSLRVSVGSKVHGLSDV